MFGGWDPNQVQGDQENLEPPCQSLCPCTICDIECSTREHSHIEQPSARARDL